MRNIKIDMGNRILSMLLAVVMIMSLVPVGIFAANPSTLSTNIGSKNIVVGEVVEFSYTTMANDYAGEMVVGTFSFSDPSAIKSLEYKDSTTGNWYSFSGSFGPSGGFPLTDNATSYFRASFNRAGTYTLTAKMVKVDGGDVLCTSVSDVVVKSHSTLSTNIASKSFVVGQVSEFNFTTTGNGDAGTVVVGAFSFSDPSAIASLEYKDSATGAWYSFDGNFGPATGFPLTDATSYFRASFNKAGNYTINAYIKKVSNGETVCSTTANVSVKGILDLYYENTTVELKFSDVNVKNSTLKNTIEGVKVTYKSDNESVVKVDDNGILVPVSLGSANITATRAESANYGEDSATYTVNIISGDQKELVWANTVPSTLQWNKSYANTVSGGSGTGAVTYSSSNEDVASVDENGVLTIKKPGEVTITAKKAADSLYKEQTSKYTLNIVKADTADIKFEEQTPNAIVYGNNSYVNKVLKAADVPEGVLTYSSSNPAVATVDENGKITTVAKGVTTITATYRNLEYYNGDTVVSYNLTVEPAEQPDKLVLEKGTTDQTIKYGQEYRNKASGGNSNVLLKYESSNPAVATVDDKGNITTHKAGKTSIIITAPGTDKYKDQVVSYFLFVELAEQTIEFEKDSIPAIVYGESFSNKIKESKTTVSYSSSDDSIASVDSEGNLDIKKSGKVTITAKAVKTEQYEGAETSYEITIIKADTSIAFGNGKTPSITFNSTENNGYVNTATVNVDAANEEDANSKITYSVVSGEELVDGFDSATGSFTVKGAGSIVIKASFAGNDCYNPVEKESYILDIKQDDQTIEFGEEEYEVYNGNNSFVAPVAVETSDNYGEGAIEYSIVKDENGVLSSIDPTTGSLVFTGKTGSVLVKAVKASDANYLAAEDEYTLSVKSDNSFVTEYSLNDQDLGEDNWYIKNVTITANEGYEVSYSAEAADADWQNALVDAVKDDTKGTTVSFYLRNTATGNISGVINKEIKRDASKPEKVAIEHEGLSGWEKFLTIVTLGIWTKDNMEFTAVAEDSISDIKKIEYYVDKNTVNIKSFEELEQIPAGNWSEYSDMISVGKNQIFVVYIKVTNNAGLYSYATTNGIIFKRSELPADNIQFDILTGDFGGYFVTDAEIKVSVKDSLPYSGLKKISYEVLCDGVATQSDILFEETNENPTYDSIMVDWESEIVVEAALNNSDDVKLVVTAWDNTGYSVSRTLDLKFSIVEPQIEVIYAENDPAVKATDNGYPFYDATREAKIVITGRTSIFNSSEAPKVIVKETKGDTAKNQTFELSEWDTAEGATPDEATHTMYVKFNGSANYEFSVEYCDIIGNELSYETEKFAVDLDYPTASVTIDETNTWAEIAKTLTFGLWKNNTVTVKASANDATSPYKYYYYVSESDTVLSSTALESLTEDDWTEFKEFSVDKDKQFTVYIKAVDIVGHVTYISSEGYIVDMQKSQIVITPDEPNENGVYKSDVNVQIDVADAEPYSGIKTVDYWVMCDGEKTFEENLYTFEPSSAPLKSDLKASFSENVTISADENNSDDVTVFVKVVDNAGNEIVEEQKLKIDKTAPEIHVDFDNNPTYIAENGVGYMYADRIAKVSITERSSNFNAEDATASIIIEAWDSEGNPVELKDAVQISDWTTTLAVPGKATDGDVHTANVLFHGDANYDFTISYEDLANNECSYENVTFAEEDKTVRNFTVDKTKPSFAEINVHESTWDTLLSILTFGIVSKDAETVKMTADAFDATSHYVIEYYKSKAITPMSAEELDDVTGWIRFKDSLTSKNDEELVLKDDERFVVYLKVTDYAGNYIYISSDGFIIDKTPSGVDQYDSMIKIELENTNKFHTYNEKDKFPFGAEDWEYYKETKADGSEFVSIPVYNKAGNDIEVSIEVDDEVNEVSSGIKTVEYWVMCDGKKTDLLHENNGLLFEETDGTSDNFGVLRFDYEDLDFTFKDEITIIADKNNSCDVELFVKVVDNAGNEYIKSARVDIDITLPTIKLSYDNNSPNRTAGQRGYYPADRTATITIVERGAHFNTSFVSHPISAKNAKNENLSGSTYSDMSWSTDTQNEDIHIGKIRFFGDANYVFNVSCVDLAGNANASVETGSSATPYEFTVDKTPPVGTISADKFGTWDRLLNVITFGLWTKENVRISATSDDVTSPIDSVTYYKTADTEAKTAGQLASTGKWTKYEEFTVEPDEKFVVYLRIEDYAGNTSYISTNGMISDETPPKHESITPEITITPEQPVNGIYNDDVTVAVKVVDPSVGDTQAYAGLSQIRYEVYNLGAKTQSGELYRFDIENPNHKELVQEWSQDDAIVVDKTLNNSNDVVIKVYATDNSGNVSEKECSIKIDTTAPSISVEYDNNDCETEFADGMYFDSDRTATIVITERNFDPEKVEIKITNSDGYIPKIGEWTTVKAGGNGDASRHTAKMSFDKDGDYKFEISCKDIGGIENTVVDYGNSVAPNAFTIDKTAPVVTVTYDNNDVANGNYYKADRTATVTVTEHNFETGRIQIMLRATNGGRNSELPTVGAWKSNGDTHTATIEYKNDSLYTFDFSYTDKAGNAAADVKEESFYIDKTAPDVRVDNIVDNSANNNEGDIGFVISATDANFDAFEPTLTAVVKTGDAFETKTVDIGSVADITNGKTYTVANIADDGIYSLTCTISDKAGNSFKKVILMNADSAEYEKEVSGEGAIVTFSVNRNGSTFGISDSAKNVLDSYYVQNVKDDIVIVETNADELLSYSVKLNGEDLVENTDYKVEKSGGDGVWNKYTYTVNKDLFDNEGEYRLVLSSTDKAENVAFSDVKDATIAFVVDRTAPVVTITGLSDDGRYQTEKQMVTIVPTDDGGALNSLVVRTVDSNGNVIDEIVNHSDADELNAILAENEGKITFEIEEGLYQNVQIICTDRAAAETEATNTCDMTINNVSVSSNALVIFWANKPLRVSVIAGLLVAIAAVVAVVFIKRKSRKTNN